MMITGYVVAVEDDPKDFQEYKGDRERNATVEDPRGHIILFFPRTDYIKKHQAASAQQQNMVDRQEGDKTVSRCENLRRRTEKEKSDIDLFRGVKEPPCLFSHGLPPHIPKERNGHHIQGCIFRIGTNRTVFDHQVEHSLKSEIPDRGAETEEGKKHPLLRMNPKDAHESRIEEEENRNGKHGPKHQETESLSEQRIGIGPDRRQDKHMADSRSCMIFQLIQLNPYALPPRFLRQRYVADQMTGRLYCADTLF